MGAWDAAFWRAPRPPAMMPIYRVNPGRKEQFLLAECIRDAERIVGDERARIERIDESDILAAIIQRGKQKYKQVKNTDG